MSEAFVADASLGVAWAADSQADEDTQRLKSQVLAGADFVVPALWPVDVANGLLMLLRRKRMTRQEWIHAGRQIVALGAELDTEAAHLAFRSISELAEQHRLTTYDAVYLELAIRRAIPLASRDAGLNKAAKKCGVKILL